MAIGFTKSRIKLLYFYEAIVLVLSSCFLGLLIGFAISYTMILQQVLIMQLKLKFYFPWEQLSIIFILSVICAFLSTYGPSSQLLKL